MPGLLWPNVFAQMLMAQIRGLRDEQIAPGSDSPSPQELSRQQRDGEENQARRKGGSKRASAPEASEALSTGGQNILPAQREFEMTATPLPLQVGT